MEVNGVRRYNGKNPYFLVEVKPSDERGIFVGNWGHEKRVGKIAVLRGFTDEDARTLETGDVTVLGKYILEDPNEPGTFHLVGCRGSVRYGEGGMAVSGVSDDTLREYSPAAAPQRVEV